MLLHIAGLLVPEELSRVQGQLDRAHWGDGRVTAGHQSARVKRNMQIDDDDAAGQDIRRTLLSALERHPTFISATLPRRVSPPLLNRYDLGMGFGDHIDNAIRPIPNTGHRLRADLSATLFLNAPEEYSGGELIIADTYGAQSIKHAAGDLVVYSAGSVHRVEPVTAGTRLVAVFWLQSMVREESARTLLFDMDRAIQELAQLNGQNGSILQLTACYHNLLRRWGDV